MDNYCRSYSNSKTACSGVAHARKVYTEWYCYKDLTISTTGMFCVDDEGKMVECERPFQTRGTYCLQDEELTMLMSIPKKVEVKEDVSADEYTPEADSYIDVLAESGIDTIQIGYGKDCYLQWGNFEGFLKVTCDLTKGIPWYIKKHETSNLYKIGTNDNIEDTENMKLRFDKNELGVRVRPSDGVSMAVVYPGKAMDDFWGEPEYPGLWIKKIKGMYAIGYDDCPLTIAKSNGKNWAYFKCGSKIKDTFWIKGDKCMITKMSIKEEDDAQGKSVGEEIVGVVTSASCSETTAKLTFTESRTVTNTITLTSSSTTGTNFGVSASMTVATTAGAIFASATTSFTAGVSVGGSRSWTNSEAKSTATSQSKSGGIMVDVDSPGGAMIVGFVKKYKMDKTDIPVTMTVECDGGQHFTYESVINLNAQTFGHTHYKYYNGKFNKDTCRQSGGVECLYNIETASYKSVKESEDAFAACFARGGGTVLKRSIPLDFN